MIAATRRSPALPGVVGAAATLTRMSVLSHVYDIPTDDELDAAIGAAVPHFSQQIRGRVASYLDRLPPDHPRRPALEAQLVRLDLLAVDGERGDGSTPDLPRLQPRPF